MRIDQLTAGLPIEPVGGRLDVPVRGLTDDSRQVGPGWLFVARRGEQADGHAYLAQAVAAGASAVLVERVEALAGLEGGAAAVLRVERASAVLGELAERFYGRPSRQLLLVGVTGTNGKTTTAYMVHHLLERAGLRCGMLTTVEIDEGTGRRAARLTTPGAIALSGHLAAMVKAGCRACVMECSSHGLEQGRCDGLAFDVGLFTNLSGDHLDYHRTMRAYGQAKRRLFERLEGGRAAVVNRDDAWSGPMAEAARSAGCPVVGYGLEAEGAEYRGRVLAADARGSRVEVVGPGGRVEVRLPLVGRHNLSNLLGAVAAVEGCGVNMEQWAGAVAEMEAVPGRLEVVKVAGVKTDFTVLVDYAHTDDALRNVLEALRPLTAGRLVVMFGCGGDRDATKRPRMAQVACRLADVIIITSDNPRSERPEAIIEDILAGVPADRAGQVVVEADRGRAIERAVGLAGPGDVVLLAGKGHETYQLVGTERLDFDDRRAARRAIEQRMARR